VSPWLFVFRGFVFVANPAASPERRQRVDKAARERRPIRSAAQADRRGLAGQRERRVVRHVNEAGHPLVAGPVARYYGWRAVFFVGILPALITLWIQRRVPESEMWQERQRARQEPAGGKRETGAASDVSTPDKRDRDPRDAGFGAIFRPPYAKHTFALLLMNFFGMFAWWGLFTWIPPYLSLPVEQGGRGFGVMQTTTLLVVLNLAGMFPGYASFGWVADAIGRRWSCIIYTFIAASIVPLYALARQPWILMVAGTLLAFFGTGFFSGSGIIGSEIFPTAVRARALGFTYNGARTMSYGIYNFSKAQDLAKEFLAAMDGPEFLKGFEASTGYNHPFLRGFLKKPMPVIGNEPKLQLLQDFQEDVHFIGYPGPMTKTATSMYAKFIMPTMLAEVCKGKNPRQAMEEAEQKLRGV